jgi:predicted ATPase
MEEAVPVRQSPPKGSIRRKSNLLVRLVSSLQEVQVEEKPAKAGITRSDSETSRLFLTQNRVVGRDKELLLLEKVYRRIAKSHSELVLIRGPSGSGKSTLLEAFTRKLPASVFRVSGKFDQLQSHAPYAALVSASDQLCRQALQRESSFEIRERIRDLLGPEINLLGSLIPTIVKMTAVEKDESATSNVTTSGQGFTCFKLLFRAFLRCVASEENPVIIFLDDIQWADEASLEVLKALVTDGLSKRIMIIGAYREGEMSKDVLKKYNLSNEAGAESAHDGSTISQSSSSTHQAIITEIVVTGLDVGSLSQLIGSVLGMKGDDTVSLSRLVLNKTNGNAFYALNFLDMLLCKELLSKTDDGLWTWEEEDILQRTSVSDNLAAILERKLRELPEQVRSILQIASFIGHSFTADVLVAIVHEEQDMIQTEYTFDRHSKEVIHEQIMMTLKVALAEGLLEATRDSEEYKFSHDRIQQCLYMDLIPDAVERGLLHQRIGTLIWHSIQNGEASDEEDWMFLATENLNRALNLVDCLEIRCELVKVNLKAAKLAMSKTAFIVASKYLRIAVRLFEVEVWWESHYDICIELYSTAAEAEKSIGCYERSRDLVQEIHKRAKSFQHQVEAYCIDVESSAVQGDLEGSIILGLEVLRDLGVKFPRKIAMAAVAKEIVLSRVAIGSRSVEDILNLPEMTDQNMLNALKLMNTIMINSFVLGDSYKEMYAAVSVRMVRLTLKYGMSALYSPVAFVGWGAVMAVLGQFERSLWAERVSLGIIDKYKAESVRGRTLVLNYSLSHLWRNPLKENVQHEFLRAYHLSMSFGDISFAYHSFVSWLCAGLYRDTPINKMHKLARSVVAEGREYESSTLLMFVLPTWQMVSAALQRGVYLVFIFKRKMLILFISFLISAAMIRIQNQAVCLVKLLTMILQ